MHSENEPWRQTSICRNNKHQDRKILPVFYLPARESASAGAGTLDREMASAAAMRPDLGHFDTIVWIQYSPMTSFPWRVASAS